MMLLMVFGVTLVAFLLVIAGMAVGVIMGRREISGSCGGLAQNGGAGQNGADGNVSCSLCSNPEAACRELGRRMEGARVESSLENSECVKDCVEEGCSKEAMDACKGL